MRVHIPLIKFLAAEKNSKVVRSREMTTIEFNCVLSVSQRNVSKRSQKLHTCNVDLLPRFYIKKQL